MADVLVLGGSGFIGSHLARALVARGDRATLVFHNPSKKIPADLERKSSVLQADLRNKADVKNLLHGKKYAHVFNLSGYIDHTPFLKGGRAVLDQHFSAVLNVVEALDVSALKSFVQVGSSDEYGNNPSPQREDRRENPIAPYSLGKTAASHFIETIGRTENFPGVVVRLFLAFGPGQDDRRFIPQIIKGCLAGKKFKASEGKQLRDFCYVDDVVRGLLLAAEKKEAAGQVINLASGQPRTVRSVVETIVRLCGGGEPEYGAIPYRTGENMSLYADISKAKNILGWSPQTDLEEGLKRTVAYYREQAEVKTA